MTAADANAAAAVSFPTGVLVSILLRLPGSDLRRFRRVCKEWREAISDPAFIAEHMDHGPSTLTHTIAFLVGYSGAHGRGFLFDEDWRLVAMFTADESVHLVGTCDGLLCFLDARQGAIHVVEPFTGDSLALPLPPKTQRFKDAGAFCFGFDPGSRTYKIFHQGLDWHGDDTAEQELYVYTIGGGGENWRRVVHIAAGTTKVGVTYSNPVFADGSLYWGVDISRELVELARFDLATEEITSMPVDELFPVDDQGTLCHLMTDSDARMYVMTAEDEEDSDKEWGVYFMGEEEDDDWTRNSFTGVTLPHGRCLATPQPLQRGHLLLVNDCDGHFIDDGGLYAHAIDQEGHDDLCSGKLLLKLGKEETKVDKESSKTTNTQGLFVPAVLNQVPFMVDGISEELMSCTTTFCYAPPLSPTALAHRCGFPCGSPQSHAKK